jgi:hypothetical protein
VMEIGNLSRAVSYLEEDERCLIANEALRIPAVLDSELGVVSESRLFPPTVRRDVHPWYYSHDSRLANRPVEQTSVFSL